MTTTQSPIQVTILSREAALRQTEIVLSQKPDDISNRFLRAALLAALGRREEAKAGYLDILEREPDHFGALNDLGNLLYAGGFRTEALQLYQEATRRHPGNAMSYVNLANVLSENGDAEAAQAHFETALRLAPDNAGAHRGLAYLFTEQRQETRAAWHREQAGRAEPVLRTPYQGNGQPVEVLKLVSASGGSIPMRHHLDPKVFAVSSVFVEYFPEDRTLPPHSRVFNAIGDADLCADALHDAKRLCARTSAPVLNPPERVLTTGRADLPARLTHIPNLVVPTAVRLPREALETADAVKMLAENGFTFPILLRAPGFHTGRHFVKVDRLENLPAAMRELPGPDIYAIPFVDARLGDGKTRKYRVMMIGGELYPLHCAVSQDWKIHYFTADMADNPAHRAEDMAFLTDMPAALGPIAMDALRAVTKTLALDYGGMDFSLLPNDHIAVWEANPSMLVHAPDSDPRWDYRRPAVERILDAVQRLLRGQS